MVEQYLGKEASDDIFLSAMLTGIMSEKQASEVLEKIEKQAIDWKTIGQSLGKGGNLLWNGLGHTWNALKEVPPAVGKVALIGAGTGVLGASLYDILKERVTQEDPEAQFNADIEAMYANKKRELEDSEWMNKVRALRDELKRGYKKMPTDEYATKYKALLAALDERKD